MVVLHALLVVLTTLSLTLAQTKTRCDVVRALRAQGVPNTDMRDWLCLVTFESKFKYAAQYTNRDGSTDNGIYQLNSGYWCGKPGGTSETTCWRLNTYGCKDTCASFRNSDITNDSNCAVRVKNCKGFQAWYAWRDNCQGRDLTRNPEYNYADC